MSVDFPTCCDLNSHSRMAADITWTDKINLIGKKVEDPRLHLCEKCNFPILIYGRMIPCKHVFCFDCAKTTEKVCLRCGDNVSRIEQTLQGHIFMCDVGHPKHSQQGCRRTYLSHRDLQAHINHRHKKLSSKSQSSSSKERRHSDPRTEPRGERTERRAEAARPDLRLEGARPDLRIEGGRSDPRLEPRTSTYQQVQNYAVGSSAHVPPGDYVMTQAPPSVMPPPAGMVQPPPSSGMVLSPSGMVQPTGAIVQPPLTGQPEYHVPVRNTNLITIPIQDSGSEYQAPLPPVQYAGGSAPPPVVPGPPPVPYTGAVPVDHQTVRPPIPYPVPHAAPVMAPQPSAPSGYPPSGGAVPPRAAPYITGPQAPPLYEQAPPSSSYGPPPTDSTTYSGGPVSAPWTAPTQSGPTPEGIAPKPPHQQDSTTYTAGSYY